MRVISKLHFKSKYFLFNVPLIECSTSSFQRFILQGNYTFHTVCLHLTAQSIFQEVGGDSNIMPECFSEEAVSLQARVSKRLVLSHLHSMNKLETCTLSPILIKKFLSLSCFVKRLPLTHLMHKRWYDWNIWFEHNNQLPEKEFQMLDQGSEIPLRDLHLSQDLRKLHWGEKSKTMSMGIESSWTKGDNKLIK